MSRKKASRKLSQLLAATDPDDLRRLSESPRFSQLAHLLLILQNSQDDEQQLELFPDADFSAWQDTSIQPGLFS